MTKNQKKAFYAAATTASIALIIETIWEVQHAKRETARLEEACNRALTAE